MISISSILARRRDRKARAVKKMPVLIESLPGGLRLVLIAIGLLTLTALPHFSHIRIEVMLVFLAFVSYRCLSARYRWLPRNRWIIYLFALIGFSISAWFYGPPIGRDPGVAFLLVMLGLKCIELSSRRDVGIVVMLGLFTVMTQFLYADGVSWTIPLLVLVAALVWLLAQMEHAEPKLFIQDDIRLVGKMLLQALPIVIILFYLFPRLSGSFFLFQGDSASGITGLGNSLRMGSISNLIESEEVAFVASFFDQAAPLPQERYWRGNNFWITDGREWTRGGHGVHLISKQRAFQPGTKYEYEIELEPNNQNWLFSLDYPSEAPDQAWLQGDHHIISREPVKKPLRYQMQALAMQEPEQLMPAEKNLALALGDTVITPRLQGLIDEFNDGAGSSVEVANRVLKHFNQQEFIYSLSPPILASQAPVDEFMFESRKGFCGHYASSFATIMRQSGIPSRVVVGYLGGEYNPRSNQIVVRQSDAHAWTEIWQQDLGWVRVDPTAAVAPERIESSIDLNGSRDSDGRVLFGASDLQGLARLFLEVGWFKDAVKAKWDRWFINFDKVRQEELLRNLGLDRFDFRFVSILAFLLALTLLTLVSLLLFQREKKPIDPVTRMFNKFCDRMQKLGVTREPNEGPRDFQKRARQALPHLETQIDAVSDRLVALRYGISTGDGRGGTGNTRQLQQLKKLIGELRPR